MDIIVVGCVVWIFGDMDNGRDSVSVAEAMINFSGLDTVSVKKLLETCVLISFNIDVNTGISTDDE